MDKQLLRQKVKQTLMLPDQMKTVLLAMDSWSDEIVSLLDQLFSQYWTQEEQTMDYINSNVYLAINNYIRHLEQLDKQKEEPELKKMEKDIQDTATI